MSTSFFVFSFTNTYVSQSFFSFRSGFTSVRSFHQRHFHNPKRLARRTASVYFTFRKSFGFKTRTFFFLTVSQPPCRFGRPRGIFLSGRFTGTGTNNVTVCSPCMCLAQADLELSTNCTVIFCCAQPFVVRCSISSHIFFSLSYKTGPYVFLIT